MISEQALGDWDFAPVHDFLRSTSLAERQFTPIAFLDRSLANHYNTASHLGDFGKIWEYLGQPLSVPPPTVPFLPSIESDPSAKEDVKGKAALNGLTRGKGVRWTDEFEGGELANNYGFRNYTNNNFKDSRRSRVRLRNKLNDLEENKPKALPSGSENESEKEAWTPERSQARQAVIKGIVYGTPKKTQNDAPSLLWPSGRPQLPGDAEPGLATSLRVLARPRKPSFSEEEITYAAAAEKKTRLMAKLRDKFIEERWYLDNISFVAHTPHGDDSIDVGVHVFVDASNIMIGFHNALKLSRGLSLSSRLRRRPLSFHNLSLILERGRPAAKRVLVGSDNFLAIQEAKAIGYETNILDRVHKAKELTPRQKKFTKTIQNGTYHTTSGQSSGSETIASVYAPEKWVEQAVDEILHLKILESVVDAKKPSTMVLATGDAAEAEYSQGFLKMVERALEKGWKVELISFRHNISGMYKRKEFRGKWGDRFKIVELDEFVEEILGV